VLTRLLAPPLCWSCGGVSRGDEPLCLGCRRTLRHLGDEAVDLAGVRVWSAVAYEEAARDLVRGLKFRGAMALADAMAAPMVANAPEAVLPVGTLAKGPTMVPVPLHPARRRRRGFNQSEILAAALARRTGFAVLDCLTRSGPAGSQVGRARAARLSAPPGRMQARTPAPRRALIVDDVATTGATLAACARALRTAGAREITAITFARTLGR
jgi:ComF family protein